MPQSLITRPAEQTKKSLEKVISLRLLLSVILIANIHSVCYYTDTPYDQTYTAGTQCNFTRKPVLIHFPINKNYVGNSFVSCLGIVLQKPNSGITSSGWYSQPHRPQWTEVKWTNFCLIYSEFNVYMIQYVKGEYCTTSAHNFFVAFLGQSRF